MLVFIGSKYSCKIKNGSWTKNDDNKALHSGPFITPINLQTLTCDAKGLKCAACLCAKAHSKTTQKANPPDERKLKRHYFVPGACVSIDHYISTTQGRLPHTFGYKKNEYFCGMLFVDHTSGKIFNYCQYSTNANKTISSK
jgi:hypothetical protein